MASSKLIAGPSRSAFYCLTSILLLQLSATAAVPQARNSSENCQLHEPLAVVSGEGFYGDKAGSVVDAGALERHLAHILPLRRYVTDLIKHVEEGRLHCAAANLRHWAASKSMLRQPTNFSGMRERQRFALAINLAALRLVDSGHKLDRQALTWLNALNRRVVSDFEHRDSGDNLYAWSGTTAAIGWLLTRDARLSDHARDVRRKATRVIQPNGIIPTEQRRGSRSLMYHTHYLAALLMLEEAGFGGGAADEESSLLLYRLVRSGTCDRVKSPYNGRMTAQHRPNPSDVETVAVFGATRRLKLCDPRTPMKRDPLRGGDSGAALKAIERATKSLSDDFSY